MEYKGGRDKSGKGQEWREITFSEKSESFDKLFQLCKQRKSRTIEVQSKFKLATLQQAYRRAVKKAGFEKQQVSLYSSRHLLGCKMKTDGLDPVTIAQALGHQATSSTKKYGYVRKGSGGSGIINTACASEVRLSRVSVKARNQGNSELLNPSS